MQVRLRGNWKSNIDMNTMRKGSGEIFPHYWCCCFGILFRILLRTVLVAAAVAAGALLAGDVAMVFRASPIACVGLADIHA